MPEPESKLNLFLSRLLLSAGSARRAPEEAGGDCDPRRRPEERGGARRARSGKEEVEPGELQGLGRPEPALERSAPRSLALRSRPSPLALLPAVLRVPKSGLNPAQPRSADPVLPPLAAAFPAAVCSSVKFAQEPLGATAAPKSSGTVPK
ncbi:hypothetical protein LEMLEM_LOCUS20075 [Lemmus lemmus]